MAMASSIMRRPASNVPNRKPCFRSFALIAGLTAAIAVAGSLGGCGSGIKADSKYRALIAETTARSDETADRAKKGLLTEDQKTEALVGQAKVWHDLEDAIEGKAPTAPTTQPN